MAIHFKPDHTIEEILAHPRYREFAADCTERGRQVVPDAFPWDCMGNTDEQILAMPLRFSTGRPMTREHKLKMILVVRAQEQLVREWWDWWLGWEWISKARKPAAEHVDDEFAQAEAARSDRKVATTPSPQEGWLF